MQDQYKSDAHVISVDTVWPVLSVRLSDEGAIVTCTQERANALFLDISCLLSGKYSCTKNLTRVAQLMITPSLVPFAVRIEHLQATQPMIPQSCKRRLYGYLKMVRPVGLGYMRKAKQCVHRNLCTWT
jgi:hypothetical protein